MDTGHQPNQGPMLLLMKGPPGTGKTTLALELGRRLRWPVIDKDDVRDLLPDEIGGISYEAMLAIAERQLRLGLSVIADSPLGYGQSYQKAVALANECAARVAVIECICSDEVIWRQRIAARSRLGLPSHHATDWAKVEAFFARTATDTYAIEVPHLMVDTAMSDTAELADKAVSWLDSPA